MSRAPATPDRHLWIVDALSSLAGCGELPAGAARLDQGEEPGLLAPRFRVCGDESLVRLSLFLLDRESAGRQDRLATRVT